MAEEEKEERSQRKTANWAMKKDTNATEQEIIDTRPRQTWNEAEVGNVIIEKFLPSSSFIRVLEQNY